MNQDWDIKPRSTQCHACAVPFTDQQPYLTRLVFDDAGYARADFCEKCWEIEIGQQPRHSAWKGIFRLPPPEPERTVRKETAESLLRELISRNDLARRNTVYILAVMLERQRVFVERDVQTGDDGNRTIIYEHRKTGETFAIPDPQLRLTELEPVQQEVMALLSGESQAATAPGGAAPPAPAPPDPAAGQ
jgi:hypothetical protein